MELLHPQERPKVGWELIKIKIKNTKVYLEPCQNSKTERFPKIVN